MKNNPNKLIIIKNKNIWEKQTKTTKTKKQIFSNYSGSESKTTKHMGKQTKNKQTNKYVQTSLAHGPLSQTSLKIFVFCCFLLFFPCVFAFWFWARVVWKSFVCFLFCLFFPCVFCFLYVPFICGIGWDSPDPWARGEWWATQRQVQRDSQLAAGRCASFRLRSAPLRSAVLRSAALRCTALRFHLVYWLGLPWALGLSWVVG